MKKIAFIFALIFVFSACAKAELQRASEVSEEESVVRSLDELSFTMPEGFRAFNDDEIFEVIGDEDSTGAVPIFMAMPEDEVDKEPSEIFMYYKGTDEEMDFDMIEKVMRANPDGDKLEKKGISRNIEGRSFKGFVFLIPEAVYYELISIREEDKIYIIAYLSNIEKNSEYENFINKFYQEK